MIEPALRFLHYALLLGLFGWTAFQLVGHKGLDWLPSDQYNGVLTTAAIAAPLVSMALMLTSIAAMMGVSIIALEWSMIEAMIVATATGWAALVRIALLVLGLFFLVISKRSASARSIAALCFAGALITFGWSGHSAATEGGIGLFHRLNNGVHLLAGGLWLGAIGWFLHLTVLAHHRPYQVPPRPLLRLMRRFAPLGMGLVATVILTGLINSHLIFGLKKSLAVLTTTYGVLLAAKVILVGGMLAFAAHNASVSKRHVLADNDFSLAMLRRSLAGEFVFGISVIGLVAVLGTMSPTMME